MKDKKLQVFVSSTYTDLKEERQAAVEAILSSGHIPAGMELFSAGDESQLVVIKRWIDESDVYLLILGGRYGSIEEKSGKSYTQLEYEYALENKKPLFAVVITDSALEKKIKSEGSAVIERKNDKLLQEFRSLVLSNLVKFWEDKKDIKIAIHETISDFASRKELIGWIRGDNSVNAGAIAEELARLAKENSELRRKIGSLTSSDGALYAGLTYMQLAALLNRDRVEISSKLISAFEYLMQIGRSIEGRMTFSQDQIEGPKKLVLYKILRPIDTGSGMSQYSWTEDGHNFYLKALYHTQSDN